MYRRTHRALALAIREAANSEGLSFESTNAIAESIANVCEVETPKTATFDRETFMALALRPTIN